MKSDNNNPVSKLTFGDYFLQNVEWVKSWQNAQIEGHKVIEISNKNLHCYVYQYPWHGKKMWYIAKGPTIIDKSKPVNQIEFEEFIIKVKNEAEKFKIVFIKLDFNDNITNSINLSKDNLFIWLNQKFNINANTTDLQYDQCAILNLDIIEKSEKAVSLDEYMIRAKPLFDTFSDSRKLQLKKVYKKFVNGEITFDESKTKENYEAFWQTHLATTSRQGLTTNSKDYNYKMLSKPFTRLLVGYDQDNKPCCGWYGVVFDDTMTYLLGGNNEVSLKNNWQHLLHLKSLQGAYNEGLKYYDFGGFDKTKGYGQYKIRFNPIIRTFIGPIDIILDKKWYQFYNLLKIVKSKLTKIKN